MNMTPLKFLFNDLFCLFFAAEIDNTRYSEYGETPNVVCEGLHISFQMYDDL